MPLQKPKKSRLPQGIKRLPRGKHKGVELLLMQTVDHVGHKAKSSRSNAAMR